MIPALADAAVAISQSLELSIAAKATAMILVGLGAARLAANARAAARHAVLAVTFASLVALPLLLVARPEATIDVSLVQATAPAVPAPLRGSLEGRPGVGNAPIAAPESPRISRVALARTIWFAGALFFAAPVARAVWRLRRIRRAGLPWAGLRTRTETLALARGIRRPVDVMRHEHVPGPITFGVLRPVIVMPADASQWSDADSQRAIVHELEHIRRRDWLVLLLARGICACYWFHPLAWAAWRQLSLEAERACDDAVVLDDERIDYAEQLVALAQRLSATQELPMLGMANRSDLSTRVSAVLDDRQRRGRAGLGLVAAAIGAASLVLLAVAPVRAVAKVEGTVAAGAAPAAQAQRVRGARASRPRALDRALYEAARDGDLDEVNQILAAGANVNGVIEGDGSPLIGAAQSGDVAIARRLLDAGADPSLPVEGDGSPLIQAAARGHLDIVTLLLDRGANVNQIVTGDENALMNASEHGHLPVVQLLVQRGANVHERIWSEWSGRDQRGEWRTAVSQARKNGHSAVVSFLMSAGARE